MIGGVQKHMHHSSCASISRTDFWYKMETYLEDQSNRKRDVLRSHDIVTKPSPYLTQSIYLILKLYQTYYGRVIQEPGHKLVGKC